MLWSTAHMGNHGPEVVQKWGSTSIFSKFELMVCELQALSEVDRCFILSRYIQIIELNDLLGSVWSIFRIMEAQSWLFVNFYFNETSSLSCCSSQDMHSAEILSTYSESMQQKL